MAYTPGFDHDIFISYARLNNKSIPGTNRKGWVSEFYLALETILKEKLHRTDSLNPEELNIWFDIREIEGNEYWDSVIEKAARNSAVMISILSERYLESEYCRKELDEFSTHNNVQIQINGNNSNRVFKALIDDIPSTRQPQQIARNNGYDFFTLNELKKRGDRLWQKNENGNLVQRYIDEVESLAAQLANVLLEILKKPEEHTHTASSIVYLAEVSDDLAEERDAIRNALVQRGVIVLPTYGLSNSPQNIQQVIENDLKRATFYIHPLGPYYKRISSENSNSLTRLQHDLASKVSEQKILEKKGFGRIVWIKPGFEISSVQNQPHREFLESLVSDRAPDSPMEVTREPSIEKLKDSIEKKIFWDVPKPKPPLEKTSLIGNELKVMLKQFLPLLIVMSNEIFNGFLVKPIAL